MAGTNILSGYVDVWSEYSFNPPINTAINDTVPLIKNYVDSELGRIYREWSNDGVSDEEISQYLYINVYWEKDGDKYWIYLMW